MIPNPAGALLRGPASAMWVAVIGDVHLAWDRLDVGLLDDAGFDLVLFVGDLAGYGPKGALRVARTIRKPRTPALVTPGNHDAVTVAQLASEVFGSSDTLRHALSIGMEGRVPTAAARAGQRSAARLQLACETSANWRGSSAARSCIARSALLARYASTSRPIASGSSGSRTVERALIIEQYEATSARGSWPQL